MGLEAVPKQMLQLPAAAGGPLQTPMRWHCTVRCHHMATGLAFTAWCTIMVKAKAGGHVVQGVFEPGLTLGPAT